jgi:antitoxin FitA
LSTRPIVFYPRLSPQGNKRPNIEEHLSQHFQTPSKVLLAFCSQQCHRAVMSVQITIRDVPDAVRDELAARAALQGKSMQEYLRAELERLAARPPVEKVLERIRERKATAGTRLSPEEILAHRDADRR